MSAAAAATTEAAELSLVPEGRTQAESLVVSALHLRLRPKTGHGTRSTSGLEQGSRLLSILIVRSEKRQNHS